MARAAPENGRGPKEEFEALRSDIDSLRKDFGTFVSTLRSNPSSRTEADLDPLEERMAQARAASDNGRDAKEDFQALRSDLDTLRKDFGTFVSTLKSNATNRTEAELDAMRQRIATLAGDLQTSGQQQLRNVEGKIEQRPFVSLAIAFATGLVVGRMLDRR
jgi:ElaB/YqjD/DUF883 family membrane-anchored ribosome-binding protein